MSLEYNLEFITDKNKRSSIKKALSILERSFYKNIEQSSFFLDPFEIDVIKSIAKKNDIDIIFLGGSDLSERKIFVSNYYYEPLDSRDYISILEFKKDFIKHPDVLGALLSLGIKRESIGDIIIDEEHCEFAVLKEDSDFIKYNLNKIKNEKIFIDYKVNNTLDIKEAEYSEYSGFVSSLRLDNLVSEFIGTSRSKALEVIKYKNVKVNFQIVDDPSKIIEGSSLISIRKEGRFIFDNIIGSSKKGNYHIAYRKLK